MNRKPEKLLLIAAAAVTAAIASDTRPLLEGDWSHHQIWSGLLSGAVLLLLGYAVLEQWMERTAARRWATVALLAFRALGRSCDAVRQSMNELLTDVYEMPEGSSLDEHARLRLRRALERPEVLAATTLEKKLTLLLADRAWVTTSVEALDISKIAHRREIAEWAPIMLGTDRLQGVLNGLAWLNQGLFDLQDALRGVRDGTGPGLERRRELAIERWRETAVAALGWQERLMRASPAMRDWTHQHARRQFAEWNGCIEQWHREHRPLPEVRPKPDAA